MRRGAARRLHGWRRGGGVGGGVGRRGGGVGAECSGITAAAWGLSEG